MNLHYVNIASRRLHGVEGKTDVEIIHIFNLACSRMNSGLAGHVAHDINVKNDPLNILVFLWM